MIVWIVPLVLVPLIDQAVKHMLRRRLGARSVPLGPLASLRMVSARVWLARGGAQPNLVLMWTIWALAAGVLVILAGEMPRSAFFVGLLLGGSLSHALETSSRGTVSDYICSKWWPAFNLADVAITIGAVGIVMHASFALRVALA
jgi:lipoprotein signal peptidase